jgi:fatty acid desaturase
LVAGVAIFYQSTAPLVYWILPVLLGQPLIRAILIAEHTGCSEGPNGLTNTRTTLTSWPVRLLMWNMPFHAEHHLYPSIPFHALPRAHARIRERLTHLDDGYLKVNRDIRRSLSIPAGQIE